MRPRELYAWIDEHHDGSSIALSCQVLGVRREGYYEWKHRPMRTDRDTQLVSALKEARKQHPCYGVRGLRETVDSAIRPSYGKCYRLCKENGLLQRKKRPHGLTKCNHRDPQSDDLVQRDFTAVMPGIKYLSDMTQIKCADGKLYLAAVLDCYDGAVVGFSMKHHMRASLCCDALRDAVSRYGYQKGLILHSDHGSQYTSQEYRTMLAGFGSIRQSMGRTHCCFDNARMESFFATLKKELVYRLKCSTMKRDEVRKIVFRWIETYYNRRRRNTANELNLPPLVKRARFADRSFAA